MTFPIKASKKQNLAFGLLCFKSIKKRVNVIKTFSYTLFFFSFFSTFLSAETLIHANNNPNELIIQLNAGSSSNAAFTPVFKKFEQETGIKVIAKHFVLHNQISDSVKQHYFDISFGQNSQRIKDLIKAGYVEPITELWNKHNFHQVFLPPITKWLSEDNEIYGVPYSYYAWGFFIKKSVIDRYGEVPNEFKAFVRYCEKLKRAGYDIFPISQQLKWLNTAWFEYLLLRTQDLDFYHAVVNGEVPYTDQRIKDIFVLWHSMYAKGLFSPAYQSYNWQHTVPYILRDKLAFMFMSNNLIRRVFIKNHRDQLDFIPFPKVYDIPQLESSPTSLLFINKFSNNKEHAKRFLVFTARPEIQSIIAEKFSSVPANINADASYSKFAQLALSNLNKAKGFSPFYDRAVPKAFDKPSSEIFTTFLLDGDIEKAIQALEALRLKVYLKK